MKGTVQGMEGTVQGLKGTVQGGSRVSDEK